MEKLLAIINSYRKYIDGSLESAGHYVLMLISVFKWSFKPPFRFKLLLQQMEFVGSNSMSIIILTGFFSGAVFSLQSLVAFRMFNAESMVGSMVALSLTRELAPVLTSLMVTGRCGSAMAAEIGTMRVTEQIDALTSMAVNPVQYLVVPRVLASIIMLPVLTMVFNVVGITGSYMVAVWMENVDGGIFIDRLEWFLDPNDIYMGLIKVVFFAIVMSTVGCFKGYMTSGGARGVGKATTQAVVISSVTILVSDYFITKLLTTYVNYTGKIW